MKIILPLFCTVLASAVHGQNVIDVDKDNVRLANSVFYSAGGHPVSSAKYVSLVGGSPYLSDTWMKGTIATPDSLEYPSIRIKLDLLDNSVIYLNPNNEEMVSVVPMTKISLRDTITGKTFLFTHLPQADSKTWYQVITIGKVSFYKQHLKQMVESKAYGSSVTEQSIRTEERFFIVVNGTLSRVKKVKDIEDLVTDKKKEFSEFIKSNKLGSKEKDFITAVEYYNSL